MTRQFSKKSLCIIGQGAFGSALKAVYEQDGKYVESYGRAFPESLPSELILLAVPTASVNSVLKKMTLQPEQIVILCCKGFLSNGEMPSSLLPKTQSYAILSGPGYAADLQALRPVVHSIASETEGVAMELAQRLSTPTLRLYWSADPLGVQICGALKNILAIAAGMADGLGLGDSARAGLITRGASELRHCLRVMGGKESTFWAPAGIGDLVLTCGSAQSRNFQFGQKIAQGLSPQLAIEQIGTVEGARALSGLLQRVPVQNIPISHAIQTVLEGAITPHQALALLMSRPIVAG